MFEFIKKYSPSEVTIYNNVENIWDFLSFILKYLLTLLHYSESYFRDQVLFYYLLKM